MAGFFDEGGDGGVARGGIAAGTIVTTGSWMGIRWVDTPADVAGIFDGVGEIKAGLTA